MWERKEREEQIEIPRTSQDDRTPEDTTIERLCRYKKAAINRGEE